MAPASSSRGEPCPVRRQEAARPSLRRGVFWRGAITSASTQALPSTQETTEGLSHILSTLLLSFALSYSPIGEQSNQTYSGESRPYMVSFKGEEMGPLSAYIGARPHL